MMPSAISREGLITTPAIPVSQLHAWRVDHPDGREFKRQTEVKNVFGVKTHCGTAPETPNSVGCKRYVPAEYTQNIQPSTAETLERLLQCQRQSEGQPTSMHVKLMT